MRIDVTQSSTCLTTEKRSFFKYVRIVQPVCWSYVVYGTMDCVRSRRKQSAVLQRHVASLMYTVQEDRGIYARLYLKQYLVAAEFLLKRRSCGHDYMIIVCRGRFRHNELSLGNLWKSRCRRKLEVSPSSSDCHLIRLLRALFVCTFC